MAELSLREEICLKRWRDLAGVSRDEQWSWEQAKLNAPMSTKSVLQEYDFYASEFLAKVDKIEKEKAGTGITSMSYAGGFNDALEMVKSLLEGK